VKVKNKCCRMVYISIFIWWYKMFSSTECFWYHLDFIATSFSKLDLKLVNKMVKFT